MPRPKKIEDVSCAICMDTLFNRPDDLDEVMPIATPDCGHVFHESCLLEWFKAQHQSHVNASRERREDTPTPSESPAECPTCRAECFADPTTGQPIIHRLYINFGHDEEEFLASCTQGFGGAGGSGQGSSPVRWAEERKAGGGRRDKEVMGFARRARGLTGELDGMSVDRSLQGDVERVVKRAEELVEEIVSVKALTGIKTYIGGLTASINKFRSELSSHPMLSLLVEKNTNLEIQQRHLELQLRTYVQRTLPQEIEKAVKAEQARAEKKIKQVREEMRLIERDLEREQAARRATKKETVEREREMENRLEGMKGLLEREQKDRKQLNETLVERTRTLRAYQAKAESRKDLKARIEVLETKNKDLEIKYRKLSSIAEGSSRPEPSEDDLQSLPPSSRLNTISSDPYCFSEDLPHDTSIEEIPSPAFRASRPHLITHTHKPKRKSDTLDESLQIDYPSFEDDLIGSPRRSTTTTTTTATTVRQHPTARKFAFDIHEGLLSPSKERGHLGGSNVPGPSKSKYFKGDGRGRDAGVLVGASSSPTESPQRSRTNPFSSTKAESEKRKQLSTSSPKKPKSNKVAQLPVGDSIYLTPTLMEDSDDSIVEIDPKHSIKSNTVSGSSVKKRPVLGAGSLNLHDVLGRPSKGLAIGTKAKRRA